MACFPVSMGLSNSFCLEVSYLPQVQVDEMGYFRLFSLGAEPDQEAWCMEEV